MLQVLHSRLKQGYKTIDFPDAEPALPEKFLGMPEINPAKCPDKCATCLSICPVDAITQKHKHLFIDLGRCIFCGKCRDICPKQAITFTKDWKLAATKRDDLIISSHTKEKKFNPNPDIIKLFGKSLKLREVSAGGCNACEADCNVLETIGFDLGRFGIQFVASPRHADGILVTGPVPQNMKVALEKTYNAISSPKVVIAVGACAISGGIYRGNEEVNNGIHELLPVDLYIPGCPPHPITILDGLLRLIGKIKE